jgi:hypothetical protein
MTFCVSILTRAPAYATGGCWFGQASKISTLNFARSAKFRMGHPVPLRTQGPSNPQIMALRSTAPVGMTKLGEIWTSPLEPKPGLSGADFMKSTSFSPKSSLSCNSGFS